MRLWCQDKNVYNSGCPSHLLDFFSLENAEVFTEKAQSFWKAMKMPLMKPWWSHGKPKLELNWALPPGLQHFTEKPSERAQHTHHVKEATLSSLGQKGGTDYLQIISFVLLHWCCSRQPPVCVRQTIGARWADCWASHPTGKLLEHPPPLFSTLPVHFRPEIESLPRLLRSGQIHRKLLSWLELPLSWGFNFPSLNQPTSHHSTKA